MTLAENPKRLGAKIGLLAVLHTWGQTLTHHPHVHCVVPGGGLSLDGQRWIACKPGFFLPVKPLARLFRRLFLEGLEAAFENGALRFFNDLAPLAEPRAFASAPRSLRKTDWVVYAKPPFGGPEQVLAYLARYTHRAAIANSRLVAVTDKEVAFSYKDYRRNGRQRIMRLAPDEFIRRFLLHVLPDGFHRIRHYGFLARGDRSERLELCRKLASADQPDELERSRLRRSRQTSKPAPPCSVPTAAPHAPHWRRPALQALAPSAATRHEPRNRLRPQQRQLFSSARRASSRRRPSLRPQATKLHLNAAILRAQQATTAPFRPPLRPHSRLSRRSIAIAAAQPAVAVPARDAARFPHSG